MIDLRCGDIGVLLPELEAGSVAMIHADPPWLYANGNGLGGSKGSGAQDKYGGLSEAAVAEHLVAAHRVAAEDAYLFFWVTFPKLAEWFAVNGDQPWEYVTGGAWGKEGRLGMGFHFRGDSELLMLYRKGNPKPLGGSKSNLWLSRRGEHSEKPDSALSQFVEMGSRLGETVLDLYAGESASLARVCRRLGRDYIGAEIDLERHRRACRNLAQRNWMDPSSPIRRGVGLPPPPPPPLIPGR